jgi:hypothetical protein
MGVRAESGSRARASETVRERAGRRLVAPHRSRRCQRAGRCVRGRAGAAEQLRVHCAAAWSSLCERGRSAEDRARQLSQTQKGRSDAKEARHAAAEAVGARAQRQTKWHGPCGERSGSAHRVSGLPDARSDSVLRCSLQDLPGPKRFYMGWSEMRSPLIYRLDFNQ